MPVYIAYERDTGKIVHRHRQDKQLGPSDARERVLRLVHPSHDRERLEILVVDDGTITPPTIYRVNPGTRTVEKQ
jgi:hypothetical protein